ncbi:MAG: head-tail adaptor protein [Sphaerochaeta sp.]
MTSIGELRDKVKIYRKEQTEDGMGGWEEHEILVMTAFARVEAPRSKSGVIAQKDTEIRSHEVLIRYSLGPKMGDIVEFLGQRLVVQAVRYDARRRWMYLDCVPEVK